MDRSRFAMQTERNEAIRERITSYQTNTKDKTDNRERKGGNTEVSAKWTPVKIFFTTLSPLAFPSPALLLYPPPAILRPRLPAAVELRGRVRQVSPLDTVKTLFETLSSACRPRPWNKRAKFWIFSSHPVSRFASSRPESPLSFFRPIPWIKPRIRPSFPVSVDCTDFHARRHFYLLQVAHKPKLTCWQRVYTVANLVRGGVNDLWIDRINCNAN